MLRFNSPPIHPETKSIVASVMTLVDSLTQKTAALCQTRVARWRYDEPGPSWRSHRESPNRKSPGRPTASDFLGLPSARVIRHTKESGERPHTRKHWIHTPLTRPRLLITSHSWRVIDATLSANARRLAYASLHVRVIIGRLVSESAKSGRQWCHCTQIVSN